MASYLTRRISLLGAALALCLLPAGFVLANTAALFNGGAVAGCSYAGASATYTCAPFSSTQDVTIASGYKVVLTGPMDFNYNQQLNMSGTAQLQVAGDLDIGGIKTSNLNISGGSLVASGQFRMGAQVQTIVADISAASMKIGTGSDTKVTGTLTASGQIDLASHATIIGPITGGKVTTGSPVSLTGDVTASVSFNLSSGSTLNGNLVSPVVSLDASPSRVNGNVTALTSLVINSSSSVNGNVVAGAVELKAAEAYITGTALVDALKLNWHGRVYQAVTCRNGTTGAPCNCVDEADSGYKNTIYGTVCVPPVNNNTVHHYQIAHDGNGLTCQPETVTVKACANADCSALYNGTAQVKLSPNSLESPAPSFSLANGSGSAYVRQTVAGAATLAISSATPTASAATTCSTPSGSSCSMDFAEAGLDVSAPSRLAGVSDDFTVRALKASNAAQSSCIPLIANTTRTLSMRCAYKDPATNGNTASRNVILAGASGGSSPGATLVCGSGGFGAAASGNLSLQFDGNGKATGKLTYHDVGLLALSADIQPGTDLVTASGVSPEFLVAPYKFSITNASASGTANPGALNSAGAVFTRAGSNFSVQVTALSKGDVITTNFGRESKPGQFELSHTLIDPAPSPSQDNVGTLSKPNLNAMVIAINAGAGSANPGKFLINNLNWNEVGIIRLTANTHTSTAYAGLYKDIDSTLVGSGTSGNIGRFIPDHFDTAIANPNAAPVMVCPAGVFPITCAAGRFVYAAQPFELAVSAMNSSGQLTKNYTGSYARPITITAWNAAGASAAGSSNPEFRPLDGAARSIPSPGPGGLPTLPPAVTFTAGAGLGSISYAFSQNFGTAAQLNTLSQPVNVFFRATETMPGGDGVSSLRTPATASVEAGIAVVAGRLQVAHSYGSELLKRTVDVESQYWTGTQFLRNMADATLGTAALTGTGVLGFSVCTKNLNPGGSCYAGLTADAAPATLEFKLGRSRLRMNAPGPGRDGTANLTVNAIPWLPSTAGRLTYGVYRSPVIYMRELH